MVEHLFARHYSSLEARKLQLEGLLNIKITLDCAICVMVENLNDGRSSCQNNGFKCKQCKEENSVPRRMEGQCVDCESGRELGDICLRRFLTQGRRIFPGKWLSRANQCHRRPFPWQISVIMSTLVSAPILLTYMPYTSHASTTANTMAGNSREVLRIQNYGTHNKHNWIFPQLFNWSMAMSQQNILNSLVSFFVLHWYP